jgi:uncharacterized membrane protein YkvA (DUF1232 family)
MDQMAALLPLFPNSLEPELDHMLAPLCTEISPAQAADLRKQITAHLEQVQTALQQNEFIDLHLAEQLAAILSSLLDNLSGYPDRHRCLIAGAARYFVHSKDVQADFASVLGFDDDAAVLNYVLGQIGRNDLRVEL